MLFMKPVNQEKQGQLGRSWWGRMPTVLQAGRPDQQGWSWENEGGGEVGDETQLQGTILAIWRTWGITLGEKEKPWRGLNLIMAALVCVSSICFFRLTILHFQLCFMILSNWSPIGVPQRVCFWLPAIHYSAKYGIICYRKFTSIGDTLPLCLHKVTVAFISSVFILYILIFTFDVHM